MTKYLTSAALILAPTLALAQAPTERTYTITIPQSHLKVIGQALGNMPYNVSRVVIDNISSQVEEQEKQAEAAANKARTAQPPDPSK